MSLRFWRRIKLFPGITLNLSKDSSSISVGPSGLRLTLGTSGARITVGGLGTGFYWTRRLRQERPEVEPG